MRGGFHQLKPILLSKEKEATVLLTWASCLMRASSRWFPSSLPPWGWEKQTKENERVAMKIWVRQNVREPKDMVIRQNATRGHTSSLGREDQCPLSVLALFLWLWSEPREHYQPEGEPLLYGCLCNIRKGRRTNAACWLLPQILSSPLPHLLLILPADSYLWN